MKISVSSTNEIPFTPDIYGNMDLDEKDRFTIIFRKLNSALNTGTWAKFESDGSMNIDLKSKIKSQIVRIDNPPALVTEKGKEIELTVDILLSDDFSELYEIVSQVVEAINDIEAGGLNIKK